MLFQVRGVRRAVGTQKEFRAAAGGGFHQRESVGFALEHRQAVIMRANAASKDGVAVEKQMVCGDRGRGETVCFLHILRCFARGDVLEHNLKFGKITAQGDELGVDEGRFAVKQVNLGRRHLAVHQQQQTFALHRFQRLIGLA